MTESESHSDGSGAFGGLQRHAGRFGVRQADLIPLFDRDEPEEAEEFDPDDPLQAEGRRIARVDLEAGFATAYVTFEDGTYLTYAARVDDDGLVLLDRFCQPAAAYADYWVFDELEAEIGPPPAGAAPDEAAFSVQSWQQSVGREVAAIGWYDEGMQIFLHLEGGGYLTFAARVAEGSAYLLGYFCEIEPANADYFLFDQPNTEPA